MGVLGVAVVCGVAVADYEVGEVHTLIGLALVGPFLVALGGDSRLTAVVVAFTVAVVLASSTWNKNVSDWGFWLRVGFTAFGGAIAVLTARGRAAEAQNRRLAEQRARVADALEAGLLPSELPQIERWKLRTLYRPASGPGRVGGDFYEAYRLGSRWMVVVGDVVGHGPEAAAATAFVRNTLRTAATMTGSAAASLEKLNADLLARPSVFPCAIAYALLAPDDHTPTLEVACAGMPRPFLIHDGEPQEVGAHGVLVGAVADARWYPVRVPIVAGDVLVLYTDGVTDRLGPPHDRFGPARLCNALRGARSAAHALRRLEAAVSGFAEGPQGDDIVVVAMEWTGGSPFPRQFGRGRERIMSRRM